MRENICRTLGSNIRAHRIANGWTLNEFSKFLRISYQQVQKYEKGRNRMPIDMAVVVATMFGCSLDELCGLRPRQSDPATTVLVKKVSAIQSPAVQEKMVALLEILESM